MGWLQRLSTRARVSDLLLQTRIYNGLSSRVQQFGEPIMLAVDQLLWRVHYRRAQLARQTFQLGDKTYQYMVHPYNHTWANERAVEIPIVADYLRPQAGNVLEVGNVLSHYFNTNHVVVDKYERSRSRHVINADILEYPEDKTYDLIVSISTVEHIGWNERPQHPEKALQVLEKIQRLLTPDGKAVITIPIGFNTYLDRALKQARLPFSEIFCLRRISRANEWQSVTLEQALACNYNKPFRNANGIVVGIMYPRA